LKKNEQKYSIAFRIEEERRKLVPNLLGSKKNMNKTAPHFSLPEQKRREIVLKFSKSKRNDQMWFSSITPSLYTAENEQAGRIVGKPADLTKLELISASTSITLSLFG